MTRVLVAAAPDLNLIDGSSVWAQMITLALAATSRSIHVDFLAKSRPDRPELFDPLEATDNIDIIDGTDALRPGVRRKRLSLSEMAGLAAQLDENNPYDLIVVRGLEIASRLAREHEDAFRKCWLYLTDIKQAADQMTPEEVSQMQLLADGALRILCQSEGFAELWRTITDAPKEKFSVYAPLVPDFSDPGKASEREPLAIYAGKFKEDWKTLDMAHLWNKVVASQPGARLIVLGDKFHRSETNPDYPDQMRHALENTEGLTWLGAVSREDVLSEMRKCRVGLSWRSAEMDDSLEYSTKILEYGAAGCAAILNRNPLHESLLGSDYPLYADDERAFVEKARLCMAGSEALDLAADRLRKLAQRHTFSDRVARLRSWLEQDNDQVEVKTNRKAAVRTLLVAGHDLKFFEPLVHHLCDGEGFRLIVDAWKGHDSHDEAESRRLLDQADVILCEWSLGNLTWYSHNKKPGQRLISRFHRQELTKRFLSDADHAAIDHIVFVGEHVRREALQKFDFDASRTSVIPNLLDPEKFTLASKMGDAPFTLGMIGYVPAMKRLDRALDILERLLEIDNRYCLRLKGRHPFDYKWMVSRGKEVDYYMEIMRRINSSERLRYRVSFDPPGDNVNGWLTMVGFVLSVSDFESFHMAVGEGMLTGAMPVVMNREGCEIWPAEFVVDSLEAAVELVVTNGPELMARGAEIRDMIARDFGVKRVVDDWVEVLTD